MKNLLSKLYEHLITKRKYNTLQLKYDCKCEELERSQVEKATERRIHLKQKEVWEKTLKSQEEEIVRLKEVIYGNNSKPKKTRTKNTQKRSKNI